MGKSKTKRIYKFAKIIIVTLLLALLLDNYGRYGMLGFVGFLIIITTYKVIKKREYYVTGLRTIESMIWKKPLDKELWDKGEMKNTKVKIRWKKKNQTYGKE